MPTTVVTCAEVEERDLEAAYLARRLSEEDAAAYEAHYFGCEKCWVSLRLATEARAAFAAFAAAPAPSQRAWRGSRVWLAAAASVIVVLGGWLFAGRSRGPEQTTVMRGAADSLPIAPALRGRTLAASWRAISGADRYLVRLYATDGSLLFQRETTDTSLEVAADSVTIPATTARILWQIQALDALRQPIVRSPLTAGEIPPRR